MNSRERITTVRAPPEGFHGGATAKLVSAGSLRTEYVDRSRVGVFGERAKRQPAQGGSSLTISPRSSTVVSRGIGIPFQIVPGTLKKMPPLFMECERPELESDGVDIATK